jgi:bis(5'-nucleosidyl)-tetraphosphatase
MILEKAFGIIPVRRTEELFEETRLQVAEYLSEQMFLESYTFQKEGQKVLKSVGYFIALIEGEPILEKKEIVDGFWIKINQAAAKITFEQGKNVMSQVISALKK